MKHSPEEIAAEIARQELENAKQEYMQKQGQPAQGFTPLRPQQQKAEVKATSSGYAPVEPPPEFELKNAFDLQNEDLPPVFYSVESLLPQGLSLLTAPSKYGKSWLMLDLGLYVAMGEPFLGFKTVKANVLYLALEDGYTRLKGRMNAILKGKPAPKNFDFVTVARTLDTGLVEQIKAYLAMKPDTKLIILDVFQKIRGESKNSNAYAADYRDINALKQIADEHNICLVAVHHNRKMKDDSDPFNQISGTNGLMGAADTIFVMTRETRTSENTTLHTTGRDIEANNYIITLDKAASRWKMVGNAEEQEAQRVIDEYHADPVIKTIKGMLKNSPVGVQCTAKDFMQASIEYAGEYPSVTPESLGKKFRKIAPDLFNHDRIIYKQPSNKKRVHSFYYSKTDNIIVLE